MRDAQHGVDLTDGPWPAAVIRELPVGLLEVDVLGRAVRENAAFVRMFSAGLADRSSPRDARDLPVTERWPDLAEVTSAVLSGRRVDDLVVTPDRILRVRGVPRWTGTRVSGGVIVVFDAGEGRPAVLDLRESRLAEVVTSAGDSAAPAIGTARRAGSAWRWAGAGPGRRRHPAGRADEHAATHDPVTGLANRVLLEQCLEDALGTCRPGRRVGAVVLEVQAGSGDDVWLRYVAERLCRLVGSQDVVARLGAGRFAIVLRELRADADADGILALLADGMRGVAPGDVRPVSAQLAQGWGMVLADPASGSARDRDAELVLAQALEVLERSRRAGRPVVGTERPVDAEEARLDALWAYQVHDVRLDDVLLSITKLAACTCETAASLVTFVDRDLQWVRAATGVAAAGIVDGRGPRHLALCDRTIRGRDVLVVPDTGHDPDFRTSSHVPWLMRMRFYAGAPLITPQGRAVGTLCVLDPQPRGLAERQRRSLAALAAETVAVLEAGRVRR